MIIYESKIGDSLSIGFLFNEAFDISRLESVNVCLGSRIYAHTIIDQMIRCELKSEDTNRLNGTLKLTLEIDDSVLGVKKRELGEVKFNVSNSQGSNASINTGYDVVVPITINEQAITIGDIMYNYVIGATGTVGDIINYPEIATPDDADVTIIQQGNGSVNSFSWSWANIKLSLKNYLDGFFEPKRGSDDNYVTDAEKIKLSKLSGTNTGDQDLSGLQHKEEGKGLSTNDYTTAEKNKLAGIESGAQVNAPNTVIDANYSTLKTAWNSAVTWVNNATQNVKNIIGIVDGGSINKFLTEAGTFAPISVGGASSSPLYYNPTPSGIGTAKTLSYIPYPTEVEAQYTLTTTEQLLTSYVYPEPIAIDTIDAGNWISKAVGRISSSSGSSFLRIEFSIYKDGVKTLLFAKSSDEINNTTFESIPGDAANGIFSVDPTGFLWVDVYGVTSGANRTLYLKIGDGNASFIQTPLRARHDGLRDLNGDSNFLHVTSSEKQTWNDKQTAGDYATNTALNNHVNAVTAHTKSQVGLGNVDNTSDANKPISTATQAALNGKVTSNATITGATKAKITYDSKGLVTGGADLTVDDIPLLPISKTDGLQEALDEFESVFAYGIKRDPNAAATTYTRIGNMAFHVSLPIQSKMRRCLLLDNGTVNYYLKHDDSTKKSDGTNAILDGTDGQVMVEIPRFYYKEFIDQSGFINMLISEHSLTGYTEIPLHYVSAYEASLNRTNNKLSSAMNLSPDYRGGNNTVARDGTYRSLLGVGVTNLSLTTLRTYARNMGAHFAPEFYESYKARVTLYEIEFANTNCQLPFNQTLTAEGYKQGGLSEGVTTLDGKWGSFNGYSPFVPCGTTNLLGNRTGTVAYTMPFEYDANGEANYKGEYIAQSSYENGVFVSIADALYKVVISGNDRTLQPVTRTVVSVPSWRGIENPFGHIWKWTDGCNCIMQAADAGGQSKLFVCGDPQYCQDVNTNNYTYKGLLSRTEGWIKKRIAGQIMPAEIGGGSTTHYADYYYTNFPPSGESLRGVLFGGGAHDGSYAGFSCAHANYAASFAYTSVGSRLCFIPENFNV